MYFKGLILLIRKDRAVGEEERALMMRIGRLFSYEEEFCQQVIDEILTNRYVVDEPPLFSTAAIARCFVQDGLRFALADGQIHARESEWLKAVAARNHLDHRWCEEQLQATSGGMDPGEALEAERFVWE